MEGLENLDLGNLLKNVDMSKVQQMFAAMNSGNSGDDNNDSDYDDYDYDQPINVEPIEDSEPDAPFDLGNLAGLAGLFGNAGKSSGSGSSASGGSSGGGSRHATMLHALKPYLSSERRGKLDMASKLMNLAQFAPMFKDML